MAKSSKPLTKFHSDPFRLARRGHWDIEAEDTDATAASDGLSGTAAVGTFGRCKGPRPRLRLEVRKQRQWLPVGPARFRSWEAGHEPVFRPLLRNIARAYSLRRLAMPCPSPPNMTAERLAELQKACHASHRATSRGMARKRSVPRCGGHLGMSCDGPPPSASAMHQGLSGVPPPDADFLLAYLTAFTILSLHPAGAAVALLGPTALLKKRPPTCRMALLCRRATLAAVVGGGRGAKSAGGGSRSHSRRMCLV